ncbi:MAG: DivIVA domain-containing protein [Acutalibacteraceae bacterium]
MYTASDIRNVEFTKNMGGFKAAEVDVFVDRCADTVEALTAEKDELNKKLAILADKLQEYRRDEDSIRSALLSAQRLGDSVVRDSNQKAEAIIAAANQQAKEIVENAHREAEKYASEKERLKKEISDFKADILSMYKEHLSIIKSIPDVHAQAVRPAEEAAAAPVAVQPEPTTAVAEPEPAQVAPVSQEADEEEPVKTVPLKSKFANLKFGEDYDIGQDQDD